MLFNFMQINNYSPIICPIHPSNSDITTQNIAGRKASIFMVCQQKIRASSRIMDLWEKKRTIHESPFNSEHDTPGLIRSQPDTLRDHEVSLPRWVSTHEESEPGIHAIKGAQNVSWMHETNAERTNGIYWEKKRSEEVFSRLLFFFLPSIGKEKLLVKKEFEWIQLGCMERY